MSHIRNVNLVIHTRNESGLDLLIEESTAFRGHKAEDVGLDESVFDAIQDRLEAMLD